MIACLPASGGYPVKVSEKNEAPQPGIGLCVDCEFMRRIASDRGSTFYRCERSATDPSFAKYPRLPVLSCSGYVTLNTNREPTHE